MPSVTHRRAASAPHLALLALAAAASIGSLGACANPRGATPETVERTVPPAAEPAPVLFTGIGVHVRPISTDSALSQQWFDQGMAWLFAFNHDEAIRSFEQAARLDPDAPAPWWAISLAHGPHINNPIMPPDRQELAWSALEQARLRLDGASPVERDLIVALGARYAPSPVEDRSSFDAAYAEAMRKVARTYPADDDVQVLFAESMMDLRPWNLWKKDGSPQPGTPEIVATLEQVLERSPSHPGAAHLYIHTVEASPNPERALAAADALRDATPMIGHLTHMPAHIDVRVGEWARAAEANRKAIRADQRYLGATDYRPVFWNLYMAHNPQFLSWACMNTGREAEALAAARQMKTLLDGAPAAMDAFTDPYYPLDLEVLTQFGRWEDVLEQPEPPSNRPISRIMWRHARGIALANLGRIDEAERELETVLRMTDALPEGALMAINPAATVLQIAAHKLRGEIYLAEGRLDEAAEELAKGVAIEDTLLYMEPPDWIQPVRRPLGAVLMKAGRYADAERVYLEDLERWPENGWSLLGLSQSLTSQGKVEEGRQARARFDHVWKDADGAIGSSCPCVKTVAGR